LALLGAHLTRRYSGYRLVWVESSSLAALRPHGCADAHAASRHLWEPETGETNIPYVRRELSGRRLGIVTFDVAVSRPFREELTTLGGYDSSKARTVVAELDT
jgi:hypothetical protein